MKTDYASSLFEALSSNIRLEIFRLLVRYAPDGLVAGEIATHLNLSANNLSFHLKNLAHSGLVSMEKEGRFLRYRASIPLMLDLIAFLTENCCQVNTGQCECYCKESGISPDFLPLLPSEKGGGQATGLKMNITDDSNE